MRPEPLLKLLRSVQEQSMYPNEILIVDGSTNNETQFALNTNKFKDGGTTRQSASANSFRYWNKNTRPRRKNKRNARKTFNARTEFNRNN